MAQSPSPTVEPSRKPVVLALLIATITAMVTFGTSIIHSPEETPDVPTSQLPDPATPQPEPVDRSIQRAVFYDEHVEPRIAETDKLNREAAERCIQRVREMMKQYRGGIEPFVDDLTSLTTRLGIVKRMPGDWWNKDDRVQAFVGEKFERYIFSEQKLMSDITRILGDFKSEVDANQRRMLIQVKSAMGTADMPEVQAEEYEPFFEAVAQQLENYSANQGTASVQNAIVVFVISEAAGTMAGRAIVIGLLARFGTTAAVSTAAGATATAGTTAAGTGTGALGGPIGAAVGFGVGMAVGLVIDWWMTEKFESKMTTQMNQYVDTLEDAILNGGTSQVNQLTPEATSPGSNGLIEALPTVCDRLKDAYRERFYEKIVTGAPENE